jgi:hypothetical protein
MGWCKEDEVLYTVCAVRERVLLHIVPSDLKFLGENTH